MKKIGKVSLALLVLSIFLLGSGPTAALGQRYRSDYEDASQKVFEEIHNFTFVYDSTTLNYAIIFGAMFIKLNSTHSRLVSDVFVVTLTSQFVSMLTATLEFDASFSFTGGGGSNSDIGVDSTSIIEFSDLLYNYTIHSFLTTNDLFPLDLVINFDWNFTSSEFSESGTYDVTKNFVLASSDSGIPGYFVPITVSILAGGILVLITFKKRKISRQDQ